MAVTVFDYARDVDGYVHVLKILIGSARFIRAVKLY